MHASRSRWPAPRALATLALAYGAALVAACSAGWFVHGQHPLMVIAVADIVGTLVIFAFSRAFTNSSFYDPYWSVAPMVIAIYWLPMAENPVRAIAVIALVWLWGLRLTLNFLRTWPSLEHEDWRYRDLQTSTGRAYWLVSLFGIHLLPTAWVYLGCLALYPAMTSPSGTGIADVAALLVVLSALVVETVADRQLHQFRDNPKHGPDAVLRSGLWRLCRHPNYLGELGFWWGLFLVGMAADADAWWTIAGPLSITLLFVFISIPMIDRRHLARRPLYAALMHELPALLPLGPRDRH